VSGRSDSHLEMIIEQALELGITERGLFLDSICAGDAAMRAELERLLRSGFDEDDQNLRDLFQDARNEIRFRVELPSGSRLLDRFTVLRRIDSGGMADVYLVHEDDFDRDLALKVIRQDLHESELNRNRFLNEAKLLGQLQNQNIVPVHRFGELEDGRPYYAMRFVRGASLMEAITRFHDAGSTPREQVLALHGLLRRFIDVCNAVAYAHSRGVLHRDIKPANIIFGEDGEFGETFLVDWGLAKLLLPTNPGPKGEEGASRPTDAGPCVSQPGSVSGTPQYMSPEQARAEPDKIGSASDIYSLGATLYCMLTGRPPFEDDSLSVVLRKVQTGQFPPPRHVRNAIPRALEAACLKAMALEPQDRYSSARALAQDIEAWMADEPVSAWREPFAERVRRWMKQNRTAVTGTAVALLAGVIGLGAVTGIQSRHNRQLVKANTATTEAKNKTEAALAKSDESRRRAEAVLGFLEDDVLASARPKGKERGLGVDVTVRKAIDTAEPKVAGAFKDQPIVEADIRDTLGRTYQYVGEFQLAIRQFERALDLRRTTLGLDHSDTLKGCNDLAFTYWLAGRIDESVALNESTLKLREANLGPDHPDTLNSRNGLAEAYRAAGRRAEAIALHGAALKLMEAKLGPNHPETLRCRSNLAEAYRAAGDNTDLSMLPETLKLMEATLGRDHPDTLWCRSHLAEAYRWTGRIDEAIALHESTLKLRESNLGLDHPDTLTSRNNLAIAYQYAGRFPEAIAMHEGTIQLSTSKLGPDHPETLRTRSNLAATFLDVDRVTDAMRMNEQTLKMRERKLGPDHPDTLYTRFWVARGYDKQGRWHDAEALWREILARRRKAAKPDDRFLAEDLAGLGHNLMEQSKWSDAEPVLRECLMIRTRTLRDDWSQFSVTSMLGGSLLGQGRYAEAEPLVVPGYEGMKAHEAKIHASAKSQLAEAAVRVVRLYEGWGKRGQAATWKARLGLSDLPADVFAGP
jgi:eukaryotic-like serine/threonine-protein kinase